MSKALLQQHAAKAIREREEQEKAIAKRIEAAQPKVIVTPAVPTPVPVKTPTPIVLTQTIVLPNNNASDIAKAKLKAEQLKLENERIAREKEALERENAALKLKYELALKEAQEKAIQEQTKQDIEDQLEKDRLASTEKETALSEKRHNLAIEENEQLVRRVSQENDSLKEELARLKKDNEEKKVSNEVLSQVLNVEETAHAVEPPVYDEGNPIVMENDHMPVDPVSDDVVVAGNADPEADNSNCSIS